MIDPKHKPYILYSLKRRRDDYYSDGTDLQLGNPVARVGAFG